MSSQSYGKTLLKLGKNGAESASLSQIDEYAQSQGSHYLALQAKLEGSELAKIEPITVGVLIGIAVIADVVNVGIDRVRLASAREHHREIGSALEVIAKERASTCITLRSLHMDAVLLRFEIGGFLEVATSILQKQMEGFDVHDTEALLVEESEADSKCGKFLKYISEQIAQEPLRIGDEVEVFDALTSDPEELQHGLQEQFDKLLDSELLSRLGGNAAENMKDSLRLAWDGMVKRLNHKLHDREAEGRKGTGLNNELGEMISGNAKCSTLLRLNGGKLSVGKKERVDHLTKLKHDLISTAHSAEQTLRKAVDKACFELTSGEVQLEVDVQSAKHEIAELKAKMKEDIEVFLFDFVEFMYFAPQAWANVAWLQNKGLQVGANALEELVWWHGDITVSNNIAKSTEAKVVLQSASAIQHVFSALGALAPAFWLFYSVKGFLQGVYTFFATEIHGMNIPEMFRNPRGITAEAAVETSIGALWALESIYWIGSSVTSTVNSPYLKGVMSIPGLKTAFVFAKLTRSIASIAQNCWLFSKQTKRQALAEFHARLTLNRFYSEFNHGVCSTVAAAERLEKSTMDRLREFTDELEKFSKSLPASEAPLDESAAEKARQKAVAKKFAEMCMEFPSFCWAQLRDVRLPPELFEAMDPTTLDNIRNVANHGHISEFAVATTSEQTDALEALGGVNLFRNDKGNSGGLFVWRGGNDAVVSFQMCDSDDKTACLDGYEAGDAGNIKYIRLPPPEGNCKSSVKDGTGGDPYPARAVFQTKAKEAVTPKDNVLLDLWRMKTKSDYLGKRAWLFKTTAQKTAEKLLGYFESTSLAWQRQMPGWHNYWTGAHESPGIDLIALKQVPGIPSPAHEMTQIIITTGAMCRFLPAMHQYARPLMRPQADYLTEVAHDGSNHTYYMDAWLVKDESEARKIEAQILEYELDRGNHHESAGGGMCRMAAVLALKESVVDALACLPADEIMAKHCKTAFDNGYVPLAIIGPKKGGWTNLGLGDPPPGSTCLPHTHARTSSGEIVELPHFGEDVGVRMLIPGDATECPTTMAFFVTRSGLEQVRRISSVVKNVAKGRESLRLPTTYKESQMEVQNRIMQSRMFLQEYLCNKCDLVDENEGVLSPAERKAILHLPKDQPDTMEPICAVKGRRDYNNEPTSCIDHMNEMGNWQDMCLFAFIDSEGDDTIMKAIKTVGIQYGHATSRTLLQMRKLGLASSWGDGFSGAHKSDESVEDCKGELASQLAHFISHRSAHCDFFVFIGATTACPDGGRVKGFDWSLEAPEMCWQVGDEEAPIENYGVLLSLWEKDELEQTEGYMSYNSQRDELVEQGYYVHERSRCLIDDASGASSGSEVMQELWVRRDPRLRLEPARLHEIAMC